MAPVAYISTPNRLTLAPPGAEKSDNPWHLREYDAAQYRELLEPHFERVEILGLFHARKLRAHELAIRFGWDRVHPALRVTKPFYDRFIPAIRATDFRPAGRGPRSRAGLRRDLSLLAMAERTRGDLAIVLHSHMPYVEGFGTYPFGEEWLFDAFARSHLPVLDVAERLTMTVTPVLADQLEADGVGERMLDVPPPPSCRRRGPRRGGCRRRAAARRQGRGRPIHQRDEAPQPPRPQAAARLPGGAPQGTDRADALGRHARRASEARHARRAAAPGRRRASLARAALRRGRRLLAAGVRVRCRPGGGAGGTRAGLHLPRSELARAGDRGAASDPAARRTGRVHHRLGHGPSRLVEPGLPVRPGVPRVPPSLAQRDQALVDLRRALRPGCRREARDRARRLLPCGRSRPPRASPRRNRAARALRVRDRHRAARPLVGRGAALAASR